MQQRQLASPLDKLAADIRRDLSRMNDSREAWIEATLDLCKHLAQAREEHKEDDVAFGKWLRVNDIKLNANDRRVAVAMGYDLDQARRTLERTKTRTLQLIDFRSPGKTKPIITKSSKDTKPPKPRRAKPSEEPGDRPPPIVNGATAAKRSRPEHRKVTDAQERLIDALAPQVVNGDVTLADVARQASAIGPTISVQPIKVAVARYRGSAPLDESTLNGSQHAKLDEHKRRLEQHFEERVEARVRQRWQAEVRPLLESTVLAQLQREKDQAETIIRTRKGVYPQAAYNKIRYCLHPDTATLATTEQRGEAFDLFQSQKLVLLSEKDLPTSFPPLPTAEELLARLRTKH